jgi:threonine dehydrogenase-like Zn-dependent dehydrogenase
VRAGIPPSLGRLGVLAEPASACARGIRHARAIGGRQPWELQKALVVGAGAIGMLSTYLLRLTGLEVWTASRESSSDDRSALVAVSGARYVSTGETPLPALGEDVGGFDLVVEATGDAQIMADCMGLLRRNGVACLLGIDSRLQSVHLDGRTIGVDAILENRVLFGSVNAQRQDWIAAVEALDRARQRWPDALEAFVGLRAPLDRFEEAFDYRGVKATLVPPGD